MVTESREWTDGADAEKEFVKSGMKAEAVAGGRDGSTGGGGACLSLHVHIDACVTETLKQIQTLHTSCVHQSHG